MNHVRHHVCFIFIYEVIVASAISVAGRCSSLSFTIISTTPFTMAIQIQQWH